MTLVEFLLARIAELEQAAQTQLDMDRRQHREPRDWAKYVVDPVIGPYGGQTQLRNVATGLYVAACSDPVRVLAECEAKRAIVEWVLEQETPNSTYADQFYYALYVLADVYTDHPDYAKEWAQ